MLPFMDSKKGDWIADRRDSKPPFSTLRKNGGYIPNLVIFNIVKSQLNFRGFQLVIPLRCKFVILWG